MTINATVLRASLHEESWPAKWPDSHTVLLWQMCTLLAGSLSILCNICQTWEFLWKFKPT